MNKIRLTGGEPLLHQSFFQIADHIRNTHSHVQVGITTNGVLVPRFIDRLKNTINSINISLDTLVPQKF